MAIYAENLFLDFFVWVKPRKQLYAIISKNNDLRVSFIKYFQSNN